MLRKLMVMIAAFMIVLAPSLSVFAEEPIAIGLEQGEVAPWDGVLFSPMAVAIVMADRQEIEDLCNLEKEKIHETEQAWCNKVVAELESSLLLEKQKRTILLAEKDSEIADLVEAYSAGSNDHIWWVIGSTAVGIVVGGVAMAVID